jgi:hypothetical protein
MVTTKIYGKTMDAITELYNQRGYLDIHATDVVVTCCILITVTVVTGYANYQSMILAIRADWDVYRCNPLIMPFAGSVMPVDGKSGTQIAMENFSYCTKKDTAIALSIAVMPIEFLMYTTVEFLDGLQEGINTSMNVTQWILEKILAQAEYIMNQLKKVSIPLQEMIIYIRDAIAKSNAILTTALYVAMNMFNLMISGTVNLMKVLSNVILIWTAIMTAMAILAIILMAGPGAVAGIALYASAAAMLIGTIIPGIVMYTIMRVTITAISSVAVDKPPKKPTMKKKKKK